MRALRRRFRRCPRPCLARLPYLDRSLSPRLAPYRRGVALQRALTAWYSDRRLDACDRWRVRTVCRSNPTWCRFLLGTTLRTTLRKVRRSTPTWCRCLWRATLSWCGTRQAGCGESSSQRTLVQLALIPTVPMSRAPPRRTGEARPPRNWPPTYAPLLGTPSV